MGALKGAMSYAAVPIAMWFLNSCALAQAQSQSNQEAKGGGAGGRRDRQRERGRQVRHNRARGSRRCDCHR
jgi:hypothetical protein